MIIVMKEDEEEENHGADCNDDGVYGDDSGFMSFTACCGLGLTLQSTVTMNKGQ